MNEENYTVIEKLKKLGLTTYEANAYAALLKLGVSEASEIALHAKVPMGRIYNVLSNLEEARIIRAQETRPRKYGCIEPAAALERLSKIKQEELKQKAVEIEALVNELASELSCMVPGEPERSFWTVARDEESLELVRESVLGAKKELLFFYASRTASERIKKEVMTESYSQVIDALNKSLKKGVDVKVIFNKEVDISSLEELSAIKQLLMHLGDKFNARLAVIPATPFDIIDGENVILQVLNPLNPEELFAAINIRDVKLAEELRKKFFTIWDKAEVYG